MPEVYYCTEKEWMSRPRQWIATLFGLTEVWGYGYLLSSISYTGLLTQPILNDFYMIQARVIQMYSLVLLCIMCSNHVLHKWKVWMVSLLNGIKIKKVWGVSSLKNLDLLLHKNCQKPHFLNYVFFRELPPHCLVAVYNWKNVQSYLPY